LPSSRKEYNRSPRLNDHGDTLARLFRGLVRLGVKPYYLFQGDLAAGTGHFRTSLEAGWRIMEELRGRLSGMAVPAYAVDLPGGGGKVLLDRGAVIRETTGGYTFRGFRGGEYTYPKEHKNEQRQ
jgi:lysine 2,3-aminomutase